MYKIIKRIFDVIYSSISIIVLLPIFLLLALLVKLTSKGPVFYKSLRLGYKGKPFTFYKFRTMVVDADSFIHDHYIKKLIKKEFNAERGDAFFKLKSDPRLTPIGRFLRKYSLDELPQLINVLKGDMSLVGPRPPMIFEYEKFKDSQMERLKVRPGITGLWQISGRSKILFDDMIDLDIYYVKNYSILLDCKILFRSLLAMFCPRDAL